ncbi:MAG: polysaccharide biosynthesis tyrosine autokinase [Acidimicrobiales bacterium]
MPVDSTERSLTEYLDIFRRRKWWIIGVVVLAVGSSIVYTKLETKKYTATAEVLAQAQPNYQTGAVPTLGQSELATYTELVTSPAVTALAKKQLNVNHPIAHPVASVVNSTDLIDIACTSPHAALAARVATAYADAFASYEHTVTQQTLETSIATETAEYKRLQADLATAVAAKNTQLQIQDNSQLSNTSQALNQDEAELQNAPSSISVIAPARVPTIPSSPKKTRDALLGLLAGVFVGLGLALALDYADDRLLTPVDVERVADGVPVLAAVPIVASWKRRKDTLVVALADPTSPVVEAYWSLRASLRFLDQERPMRSIVVTSPAEGEGKTTTIANLGVVLAKGGQRTLVVSCDLRRPRLGNFFKEPMLPGLISVLLGDVSLQEAIAPVDPVPNLWFLDTGPLPPDPHRALVGAGMQAIFEELRDHFDIVLIDSPPLLPVADALALGQIADATLILATYGQTHKRQLRHALEAAKTARVPVVGIILNEVSRTSPYGYANYSGYGYSSSERKKAAHKKERSGVLPLASTLNGAPHAGNGSMVAGGERETIAASDSPSGGFWRDGDES